MFRTKKDVERHVFDVLSKIDNENEKFLRGYTCARLFFQVKDYESAKKYLTGFLTIRDHHAASHKLMAQIYDATNNPENALQSFKRSLEIDPHQNDIVLKICELYCQLPVDHETARYWADRAEQLYPHHETVFKLREYLVTAEGEPDRQELENLIANELVVQPNNIELRIKLLRLYLDTERVKEAYDHATMIESKRLFPNSMEWYYLLGDVFEAYQEECEETPDFQFYINYLAALDHLIFLTLAEPHTFCADSGKKSPSLNDAAAVLLTFDQLLKKTLKIDVKDASWNYCIHHMKGQLYFHMMSMLMKRVKMDQGNRKEAFRFSSGLALVCYTFKPANLLQEMWFLQMENNQKVFTNFFQQGTLRASYIGHVLLSLCRDEKSGWLQKMKTEVCIPQVKERIYNRVLSSLFQKELLASSYFVSDSTFEQSCLELPTEVVLNELDKSAYKLCATSLHQLVWLELHGEKMNISHDNIVEIFKSLQYSNKNLSKGSCESLCVLDLEAYLSATVYQAKFLIQKRSNIMNTQSDQHLSYPPHIADTLCTSVQAVWWKSAHGLFSSTIKEKLGEHRRNLQHGLEVIRGIGNHGMEVQLVIHLAQSFSNKADSLDKNSTKVDRNKNKHIAENVTALYSRATHYWNIALGILDKLFSGITLNVPKDPMFSGSGAVLSKNEIKAYIEEGNLFLAVRLMDEEKLNEAAELLSSLSSPYASFYLAQTLMKLAAFEARYSSARIALLKKARDSVHNTMDRIKDDSCHPLNKDMFIVLEDIENELAHESSINNENSCEDADETDTYDLSPVQNHSFSLRNNSRATIHSTPHPSSKFVPSYHSVKSEQTKQHFQPSPERLDAQIRALTLNQDTLMKSFLEQQQVVLETNKSIVDALNKNKEVMEELKRQLEELSVSGIRYPRTLPKRHSFMKGQGDEEEEYYDPHAVLDCYEEEEYRGYSFDRRSRIVHEPPPSASASLNYVMSPALPPGPPPALNHYNYQYPPHAVLPTPPPAVAERPQYYHPPSQGLPFSEGQQLPQFHFHVASSVVKPPAPATLTSSLAPVMSGMPTVSVPPPSVVLPPPPVPLTQTPWSKTGQNAPHAFQIPLPTTSVFTSTISAAAVSTTTVQSPTIPVTSHSQLKDLLQTPPASKSISFVQPVAVTPPAASIKSPSIFSGLVKTPDTPNERSRCDSENAANSDIDSHDLEREVMGDFKPLIPLPAEVIVETGEENETVLFEDRAKLYRFVDQEWKERGIGTVKILHHEGSGRVRLLMRRDQVLKVCANHYITSNMEIHALRNSDKAWTWVAPDFADEELRPEQFCIRFKTPEIALSFKNAFLKAINISKEKDSNKITSPKINSYIPIAPSQKPFGEKFLPKAGYWSCSTCYVSNPGDKLSCMACKTKNPGIQMPSAVVAASTTITAVSTETKNSFQSTFSLSSTSSTTISAASSTVNSTATHNVFGGFTFLSNPVIKEAESPDIKDREILVVSTKSKDSPQVTKVSPTKCSPFSGFSFQSPSVSTPLSTSNASPQSSFSFTTLQSSTLPTGSNFSVSNLQSSVQNINPSFVFEKNNINNAKSSPVSSKIPETLVIKVSSEGRRVSTDGSEPTPEEFVPTAEFKPVVPLPALVEVRTGEEEDEKIFGERAKLFRFDSETKEWKERGTGELKILFMKKNYKYRILMRREQVLKLCANHNILPEMKLTPLNNSDRAWIWVAHDFSEGEVTQEKFAVKFKNKDIAQEFYNAFEKCQKNLLEHQKSDSLNLCDGNKNAFEQLLQPSPNSWTCSKCSKSNMNQSSCVYCQTPRTENVDNINASADEVTGAIKAADSLNQTPKPLLFEDTTGTPSAAETTSNNLIKNDKPLSELFKPQTGSWECKSCYVRNNADCIKCVSCDTVKSGITASTSNKNDKPLSGLFKPQTGTWECKSCYVHNNADSVKCAACETVKPSSTASSSNFGQFQFGLSTITPTFGIGKPGDFVFGAKPALQPSTFGFGFSAISNTSNESTGFKPCVWTGTTESSTSVFGTFSATNSSNSIFGGTMSQTFKKPDSTTAFEFTEKSSSDKDKSADSSSVELKQEQSQNVFSFGSTAAANQCEFSFGSPQKYEFNFSGVRPRSPTKTPKSPEAPSDVDDEGDESFDADNIYFQPVIPLPPKVDVKTGEENEKVLFCQRVKLFRFCAKEWKERGIGDIKILYDEDGKKIRLLMRRDQVLKVCLNHYLNKDIKFEKKNDKTLTWAATDYSESDPSDEIFALKFKTSELADDFLTAVKDSFKRTENPDSSLDVKKAAAAFSFKTDTSKLESSFNSGSLLSRFGSSGDASSKPFSFSDKPSSSSFFLSNDACSGFKFGQASTFTENSAETDSEIQIVYESKDTPEKEARAKELLLPPTFYLYENKPPCPGCIGCEDNIPLPAGSAKEEKEKVETTAPVANAPEVSEDSLFNLKNKMGFGDLVSDSAFTGFGSSTRKGFEGAGTPLFASLNNATGDDNVPENPDIHFEPVIPLPELVDVKTGEEDETPVFTQRAKLFKYDVSKKEWKERGIGDLKILKHNEKLRFRIILRREQVYKIACNHCIDPDMELSPLNTSVTAVCWNALDFSEGEGEASQFAVRFKNKDILESFKQKFNECKYILLKAQTEVQVKAEVSGLNPMVNQNILPQVSTTKPTAEVSGVNQVMVNQNILPKVSTTKPVAEVSGINQEADPNILSQVSTSKPAAEFSDSTTESSADGHNNQEHTGSDSEEYFIFEKRCTFEVAEENEKKFSTGTMGTLTVEYDEDLGGYRIQMVTDREEEDLLCDHIIAIETSFKKEGNKRASWQALDMAVEPPRVRKFRATFNSEDALREYDHVFEEGITVAKESELHEKAGVYAASGL